MESTADSGALERRLEAIDAKLDRLTREMEEQRKVRRERQELTADLGLVGKDMYEAAVVEFERVAPHFEAKDLMHLLQRLLRNVRSLTELLDRLEGLVDLGKDVTPLGSDAFNELLRKLDVLDRKGYFDFARELGGIADTVVTSFTVEDVRALREASVSILTTVKNMTQPEVLAAMNNAVTFYGQMGVPVDEEVSTWDLVRELNTPEARRGMAFMIRFLKSTAATKYEEPRMPSQAAG